MRHVFTTAIAIAAATTAASAMMSATVDFAEQAPGTTYGPGAPGSQMVGELIFSDELIDVRIGDFYNSSNELANNTSNAHVTVGGTNYNDDFPDQSIEFFANIALQFDFTSVGFNVSQVTLQTVNHGGSQSIGVNGDFAGFRGFDNTPASLGGVSIIQSGDPFALTTLTFTGDINTITIGGQELSLDNVIATPAPTTAATFLLGLTTLTRRRRTN